MGVPGGAVGVVEGSSAGAVRDRAERPLVDRVVETAVAHVTGQHCPFLARRDGQWGGSGVVLARLSGGVAVRVVPELTEHPGAEYDTKSWQGAVDVGVRVRLKMGGQRGLELDDLIVEFGDDMHRGGGGGAERGDHRFGGRQVLGA